MVLIRYNLLCFFSSFGSLHPTLRPNHEDMGPNFILEAVAKTLSEKASDMPSVLKARCSKASVKSSTVPNCFNFVKEPKWLVSVSKKYSLDANFFSIATIANVLDLDGEHHTRVWKTHLSFHTKRIMFHLSYPASGI